MISRDLAKDIAQSMRNALSAEGVIVGMEDGDVAGEHIRRIAADAFGLAESGMLSAKAIAPLARFAPKHPRVANWVVILRRLLAAQEAA